MFGELSNAQVREHSGVVVDDFCMNEGLVEERADDIIVQGASVGSLMSTMASAASIEKPPRKQDN